MYQIENHNFIIPRTIAIIDDDESTRYAKYLQLNRLKFDAKEITGRFSSVDELLGVVKSNNCEGALIDNRLRARAYARFHGAEIAAALNRELRAAVLVSQFLQEDTELVIRKWNKDIPAILTKHDADDDVILRQAFEKCVSEFNGNIPYDRRTSRVLVQIESIKSVHQYAVTVKARIRSWDPDNSVRFPISLIPNELHDFVLPNQYFIASVNVGCSRPEDLFLTDFAMSKEAASEDRFVYSNDY